MAPHENALIRRLSSISQWLSSFSFIMCIFTASIVSTSASKAYAQSIQGCDTNAFFSVDYIKEISLTSMSSTLLVSLPQGGAVDVSSIRDQISPLVQLSDGIDQNSQHLINRNLITLPLRAELGKYPFLEAHIDLNIPNQPQVQSCVKLTSQAPLEGNLRGWKHTRTEVTAQNQGFKVSYTLEKSRIQIFFDVIFPLGALIMISIFTSLFMDVRNFERIPWKIGVQVTLLLAALFLRSSYERLAPPNNALMHGDVMFITCYLVITVNTLFPMAFRAVKDPELTHYPRAYRAVLTFLYFAVATSAATAILFVRGLI